MGEQSSDKTNQAEAYGDCERAMLCKCIHCYRQVGLGIVTCCAAALRSVGSAPNGWFIAAPIAPPRLAGDSPCRRQCHAHQQSPSSTLHTLQGMCRQCILVLCTEGVICPLDINVRGTFDQGVVRKVELTKEAATWQCLSKTGCVSKLLDGTGAITRERVFSPQRSDNRHRGVEATDDASRRELGAIVNDVAEKRAERFATVVGMGAVCNLSTFAVE